MTMTVLFLLLLILLLISLFLLLSLFPLLRRPISTLLFIVIASSLTLPLGPAVTYADAAGPLPLHFVRSLGDIKRTETAPEGLRHLRD
jgi:hypothetical protein